MKRFLFILVLGCFSSASVWAQATAQISGAAKDQSGAVLPGVEITVTQTDTGMIALNKTLASAGVPYFTVDTNNVPAATFGRGGGQR